MKICPICKIEYSDEAEYCAKCKAYLQKVEKQERVPYDGKRMWIAILSTIGFMLVIAGIYYLIGILTK